MARNNHERYALLEDVKVIRFSVIRIRKVQFVICCHVPLKQFYKLDNSIIRKKKCNHTFQKGSITLYTCDSCSHVYNACPTPPDS